MLTSHATWFSLQATYNLYKCKLCKSNIYRYRFGKHETTNLLKCEISVQGLANKFAHLKFLHPSIALMVLTDLG